MQIILLFAIAVGCVMALYRWYWGFFFVVIIGLIQDPLRKLIPEAGGLYALSIAPVWFMTLASGLFNGQLKPQRFINTFPRVGRWIVFLAAYSAIPFMISATYGAGSWQISVLGLLIYSMAIFTLFSGSMWPPNDAMRINFLEFYVVAAGISLVGGPLEFWLGSESYPVLGTSALGTTWVTYRTGEAVYMLAGFFRGPDIMGWHASMVFMLASILAIKMRGATRYIWISLAVWSIMSVWICGRRKIISMIPLFAGYFVFLFFYYRGMRRLVSTLSMIAVIGGVSGYVILSYVWENEVYNFYMTTFTEAGSQFTGHGFESVLITLQQSGFWGYGLGMGMQGTHHVNAEKPRLWHESGPTK